jgi:hypothetical protein
VLFIIKYVLLHSFSLNHARVCDASPAAGNDGELCRVHLSSWRGRVGGCYVYSQQCGGAGLYFPAAGECCIALLSHLIIC